MEIGVMSYWLMVLWVIFAIASFVAAKHKFSYSTKLILILSGIVFIALFINEFTLMPPGIARELASEVKLSEVVQKQSHENFSAEAKIRIIFRRDGEVKSLSLVKGSTTKPELIKEQPAETKK